MYYIFKLNFFFYLYLNTFYSSTQNCDSAKGYDFYCVHDKYQSCLHCIVKQQQTHSLCK